MMADSTANPSLAQFGEANGKGVNTGSCSMDDNSPLGIPRTKKKPLPSILSASKMARETLKPLHMPLLQDHAGNFRLIANVDILTFHMRLPSRQVMGPEQFRHEIRRIKQQIPFQERENNQGHKIALELATTMATQSRGPVTAFCPCVERLLRRIKHGALTMALIPRGYDSQTLKGQDRYRLEWAELAVPEYMGFIIEHLIPYTPNLKTLQLVAPEKNNSGNRFGGDGIDTPGRRQGGYPSKMRLVSLADKIAVIEGKAKKIQRKKFLPNKETDLITQLWEKEWNLAHDVKDLLIIDQVLRKWQEEHPTGPKIELAIEVYTAPFDFKGARKAREWREDVEFLIKCLGHTLYD
jgi:hypothetical protein